MRISDWSSDVCSSDLRRGKGGHRTGGQAGPLGAALAGARPRVGRRQRQHPWQRNGAPEGMPEAVVGMDQHADRKSTRLELQSLMRISYAVFCLKKKTHKTTNGSNKNHTKSDEENAHGTVAGTQLRYGENTTKIKEL